METTELYHHGIKGMKWGIRRFQKKDGSLTPEGKKRYSENDNDSDSSNSSKSKTSSSSKSVSEMSDDELRTRLNRINLELQYKDAVARMTPDRTKRARKVLADLGEQAVRNVGTKLIEKAVKKMFDTKSVDSITNWKNVDPSKLGDKQLKSALNRASTENALQKIIDEQKKKTK